MSLSTITVALCFLAVFCLPVWPMEYRLFSYDSAAGTSCGFRGRKWRLGLWKDLGRGKGSRREVQTWIARQPKTAFLFGAVPAPKAAR
jgi:hypothetical protein